MTGRKATRAGRLEDHVGVITGAGSGIGRSVALRFVEEGAKLVALDRDAAAIAVLEQEGAGRIQGVHGDVRDPADHARAVQMALDTHGKLDVLVGNAGLFDFWRPLRRYTPQQFASAFDEIFDVNVKGICFAAMAAREALAASRGAMIFTASPAGVCAGAGGLIYTASKHALVGMVRQLAHELAPDIRVNGVGPGPTLTRLSAPEALGGADRTLEGVPLSDVATSLPLGFLQEPSHHASLYVLLASREESAAVTGEVFMSDGGLGVRGIGSRRPL